MEYFLKQFMKKKLIYAKRCDYCKREITLNSKESDSYVVTAELKTFCLIQTSGKPAERDCMADYLNNIKQKLHGHTFKKELEKKEKEEEAKLFQKVAFLDNQPFALLLQQNENHTDFEYYGFLKPE